MSDCLSMIHRVSSPARDRSYLGSIMCDIKSLKTDFESCLFKFSNRKTNVVAHKLARFAEPLVCNISVSVTSTVALAVIFTVLKSSPNEFMILYIFMLPEWTLRVRFNSHFLYYVEFDIKSKGPYLIC